MKNIKIPTEIIEAISVLSVETCGEIFMIINNYVIKGILPDDNASPIAKSIFKLSKNLIDKANRPKINRCKQSKNSPQSIEQSNTPQTTLPPEKHPETTETKSHIISENFAQPYNWLFRDRQNITQQLHVIQTKPNTINIFPQSIGTTSLCTHRKKPKFSQVFKPSTNRFPIL